MKRSYFWCLLPSLDEAAFGKVADHIAQEQYSNKRKMGFLTEERTKDYISGQYVERQSLKEIIKDPFGRATEVERIVFEYLPFRLQFTSPQVEFVGGSRTHSKFFARLGPAFPGYFSEERAKIDITKFLSEFGKVFSGVQVLSLRVDGLLVNNRTLCGIDFRSSVDVRADAKEMTKGKKGEISYAKVQGETDNGRIVEVELWKTGKVLTDIPSDSHEFAEIRSIIAKQPVPK